MKTKRRSPILCMLCGGILLIIGARAEDFPSEALMDNVSAQLATNIQGRYSVYVEDLGSGKGRGIREDVRHEPWSLLKTVVMATVLKRIDRGEIRLADTIELKSQHVETGTTLPSINQAGDLVTIEELLHRAIALSDNGASFALAELFKARDFQHALAGLGLPTTPEGRPPNALPLVSPRQYANLLRSLYRAEFLAAATSDLALQMLSDCVYASQLPRLLPPDVRVAHMVGFNAGSGDFHDCGIVYHPAGPYMLGVMSSGNTREEADGVISGISKLVYDARSLPAMRYGFKAPGSGKAEQ